MQHTIVYLLGCNCQPREARASQSRERNSLRIVCVSSRVFTSFLQIRVAVYPPPPFPPLRENNVALSADLLQYSRCRTFSRAQIHSLFVRDGFSNSGLTLNFSKFTASYPCRFAIKFDSAEYFPVRSELRHFTLYIFRLVTLDVTRDWSSFFSRFALCPLISAG